MDLGLARARESYAHMVRKARAAGIEVIVATEITVRRRTGWSDAVRSWIGWLLDLQPVLSDSRGRRRAATCQPDGVHVSPPGYDALTAYAVPRLERRFSGSSGR